MPPKNGGSTPSTTIPSGEEDDAPSDDESPPDTTIPSSDDEDELSEGTSTTEPTDAPVVDLDLDATVVVEAGTRAIVIRGESIDRAAKSVGVNDGRVRLRPSGGNWQVAALPNPPDMTVVLNDANALDIEFVPMMGETVKVSVPLEITVNDNGVSPWLVLLLVVLAGAFGFFAFAVLRRRQTASQQLRAFCTTRNVE